MMIEVLTLATVRERFGTGAPRRQFLYERLHAVVTQLHETGKVAHIYLFGSFPTEAPMPNDVDLFVVMAADFRTTGLPMNYWLCLRTTHVEYAIMPMSFGSLSRSALNTSRTRSWYSRGTGSFVLNPLSRCFVISNDEELHQAETAVQKLWRFLEQARQTHACADYERLAAPYLLQIQDRQQEILAYLSTRPEVLRA